MTDVLVVGAGIFGVTAALALRKRGADVVLVDAGPVPHERAASTDISKLVRADYGEDVFYSEMALAALDGWRVANRTWDRPLFHETGLLVLSGGDLVPGSFERTSFDTLTALGCPLERLDAGAVHARLPAWSSHVAGYVNPTGGWVESANVVRAYAEAARRAGVVVREGIEIAPLAERSGRLAYVTTRTGERLSADTVVLAVGAATTTLVPELADRLVVVGQPVFHFGPLDAEPFSPPAFLPWAADIANAGWYGFPLCDGILKIANHGPGERVDPAGERTVDACWEGRFRSFLRASLPLAAEAPVVRTRLCLYSDSFDGDLFVDRHPAREGLVVAAGDSGHAFKFAPLLGDMIADVVESEPNRWAERFRWRELGERRLEAARWGGS